MGGPAVAILGVVMLMIVVLAAAAVVPPDVSVPGDATEAARVEREVSRLVELVNAGAIPSASRKVAIMRLVLLEREIRGVSGLDVRADVQCGESCFVILTIAGPQGFSVEANVSAAAPNAVPP